MPEALALLTAHFPRIDPVQAVALLPEDAPVQLLEPWLVPCAHVVGSFIHRSGGLTPPGGGIWVPTRGAKLMPSLQETVLGCWTALCRRRCRPCVLPLSQTATLRHTSLQRRSLQVRRPVGPSVGSSVRRLVGLSVGRSVGWFVSRLVGWSVGLLVLRLADPSVRQSVGLVNRPSVRIG